MINQYKNLSDEQLVAGFQSTGDKQFFGEIYNRYYKKAYHTCLGIVKDRDVACDMVQDVMIKAMHNLQSLRNADFLGLWIYRIAKNYCIDYYREHQSRPALRIDQFYDLADENGDQESSDLKSILLDRMTPVMDQLNATDRSLLTLKYLDNYSVEDLQAKYILSESAVKMRLARARNRMLKIYQKEQFSELYA